MNNSRSGVAIAALVCGILGFFCNPMYLVSVAAIILGIVGLCQHRPGKGMALWGAILGGVAIVMQLIMDILLSIFTMGIGAVSFFI